MWNIEQEVALPNKLINFCGKIEVGQHIDSTNWARPIFKRKP